MARTTPLANELDGLPAPLHTKPTEMMSYLASLFSCEPEGSAGGSMLVRAEYGALPGAVRQACNPAGAAAATQAGDPHGGRFSGVRGSGDGDDADDGEPLISRAALPDRSRELRGAGCSRQGKGGSTWGWMGEAAHALHLLAALEL